MDRKTINDYLNHIYHKDCIAGMKELPNHCIDLIIADPPYFKVIGEEWDYLWRTETDYIAWARQWIAEIGRIAKPTASFYIFGYFKILALLLPIITENGFEFRQDITIDKGMQSVAGRKTSTYRLFPNVSEKILFFVKDNRDEIKQFLKTQQQHKNWSAKEINTKLGVEINGGGMWSLYTGENIDQQRPTEEMWHKLQSLFGFEKAYKEISPVWHPKMGVTDVWNDLSFAPQKQKFHPTQKPIKLIERLMLASSDENDIVIDPFIGGGTTAVVARKWKRNYIGYEIDAKYWKKARQRVDSMLL